MSSRFLVTTALEETWRDNQPTLFLGEWAKKYDRRHIWQSMDALVARPFGADSHQRERDFEYVQALSKCLLGELSSTLNRHHNIQYSTRQWNIILGHWLTRYVSIAFNRYFSLKQALDENKISNTTILNFSAYSLSTCNSLEFIWACNDDVWNHVFFSRVLCFLDFQNFDLQRPQVELARFTKATTGSFSSQSVRSKFVSAAKKILPRLSRKNDAFIMSSYLPFKEEVKLQLSLGQCPQWWSSPSLRNVEPDMAQRVFLSEVSKHEGFERFVRLLLNEAIPSCYVEGLSDLRNTVDRLLWPAQPKFIYTANNFDLDEVFKVWTANKITDGVPYYVGQHGAGYGTHKFFQTQYAPERHSSDKFLTWGWLDADPKNLQAYVFTVAARKANVVSKNGGLLLIEASPPHRLMHWDSYFEFGIFQEEQFRFVQALPREIHQLLTVRLHGAYKNFRWSDEQRWVDRSPSTKIETGVVNIRVLVEQSRLVVHAYDSTGILECLALNIPTLCFWHGGLEHLLPEARPHYQLLIDAGILLDSPERAAERVAMVWNDVEGWWAQSAVQQARKKFCDQYARVSQNPVRHLKKMLQE